MPSESTISKVRDSKSKVPEDKMLYFHQTLDSEGERVCFISMLHVDVSSHILSVPEKISETKRMTKSADSKVTFTI